MSFFNNRRRPRITMKLFCTRLLSDYIVLLHSLRNKNKTLSDYKKTYGNRTTDLTVAAEIKALEGSVQIQKEAIATARQFALSTSKSLDKNLHQPFLMALHALEKASNEPFPVPAPRAVKAKLDSYGNPVPTKPLPKKQEPKPKKSIYSDLMLDGLRKMIMTEKRYAELYMYGGYGWLPNLNPLPAASEVEKDKPAKKIKVTVTGTARPPTAQVLQYTGGDGNWQVIPA